jgi:hypothetical protein
MVGPEYCRTQAEEAHQKATESPNDEDRTFWLRLADQWSELALLAQQPSSGNLVAFNRRVLLNHLHVAERHVREAERHVEQQRGRIADLERHGHDSTQAIDLLATFEEMLQTHIAERARIQQELDQRI